MMLASLIFFAAILYASVGHGGASGYLAAMALAGIAPEVMKPTALSLNILVSAIATYKFYRARAFSWSLLWPFIVTSIPMAYWGGSLKLPAPLYKQLVGAVLIYAAIRLFLSARQQSSFETAASPPRMLSLLCGAGLGFLSGLTGVGGGIFLTPLLLLMRWSTTKTAAGASAAFIFVNSIAGLIGHGFAFSALPKEWSLWAIAAVIGGVIGAELGSKLLQTDHLRRILAVVLSVAGLKMIFF